MIITVGPNVYFAQYIVTAAGNGYECRTWCTILMSSPIYILTRIKICCRTWTAKCRPILKTTQQRNSALRPEIPIDFSPTVSGSNGYNIKSFAFILQSPTALSYYWLFSNFIYNQSVWSRVRETVRPKKEDQVTSANSKSSFLSNKKKGKILT